MHGFRHAVTFYAGADGFLECVVPFVREGAARRQPTLVVVDADKIRTLRDALGAASERVEFADMSRVGANPGRIIPFWQDFVHSRSAPGHPIRGVGEPISNRRSDAALVECQRHEALLNVAFDDGPAWDLLCPYDTGTLPPSVVDEARRTHPLVRDGVGVHASAEYPGVMTHAAPSSARLPAPPPGAIVQRFTHPGELHLIRRALVHELRRHGVDARRIDDITLVVGELASNSIQHAGGRGGTFTCWFEDGGRCWCEVRDAGRIDDPLAGRRRAAVTDAGGRGLWIANQLADLVQIRADGDGGTVRAVFEPGDLQQGLAP